MTTAEVGAEVAELLKIGYIENLAKNVKVVIYSKFLKQINIINSYNL